MPSSSSIVNMTLLRDCCSAGCSNMMAQQAKKVCPTLQIVQVGHVLEAAGTATPHTDGPSAYAADNKQLAWMLVAIETGVSRCLQELHAAVHTRTWNWCEHF
jgi:hypothetical protein